MKLDLLLEREPFEEIFVTTLSKYLNEHFGWTGEIQWNPDVKEQKHFLVNRKLNLIYPDFFTTSELRTLASEYRHNHNLFRRLLQSFYVNYSVSFLLRKFSSSAFLSISPFPKEASHWCILPGNRTIRIVDIVHNHCIVLHKKGFEKKKFNQTISIRKKIVDMPGPRLLDSNTQQGWYTEERIYGTPINRIGKSEYKVDCLIAAKSALLSLYQNTARIELLSVWCQQKVEQINNYANKLPSVYNKMIKVQIKSLLEYYVDQLNSLTADNEKCTLKLALSHGDFQPANILVPKFEKGSSVYLIDWEFSYIRCVWYDALVFDLNSRSPIDLSIRVKNWLTNSDKQARSLGWCGVNISDQSPRFFIITFLIEDLLMRLNDTKVPCLLKEDLGFLTYIEELSKLTKVIN